MTRLLTGTKAEPGADAGWTIAANRSGAWSWNLGDGEHRLDYEPTATRQGIFDDRWHQVGFVLVADRGEARLFFDGVNVAIYDLHGFDLDDLPSTLFMGEGFMGEMGTPVVVDEAWTDDAFADRYDERFPQRRPPEPQPQPVTSLSVMAWNIWHGGRENGAEVGPRQVVDVIRDSGADIVCMQETYGSGSLIADALGWYFYLRSSNLSIMSRFPIDETYDVYRPFFSGGATVSLPDGRDLAVHVLWIHHLPDCTKVLDGDDVTAESIVAGEADTRLAEITGILADMATALADADRTPVILAGDFNSPSHLDWTAATASQHRGLVVPWPVSRACADAGLVDAYRSVHPDPVTHPGVTWSPRFGMTDRIDSVYFKGGGVEAVEAEVIDTHADRFPSDHAAVVTRLRLEPRR